MSFVVKCYIPLLKCKKNKLFNSAFVMISENRNVLKRILQSKIDGRAKLPYKSIDKDYNLRKLISNN